jgi:uncharacterized protein with PQ loop repeat
MINILGVIASIILISSCIPQVAKSITDGHSDGLSWGLLSLWFLGLVLMGLYVALSTSSLILIGNCLVQLALVSVLIYYKINPRR